jgi:hypothetical protein
MWRGASVGSVSGRSRGEDLLMGEEFCREPTIKEEGLSFSTMRNQIDVI